MTTLCVLGDSVGTGRYAVPDSASYGGIMAARLGWAFVNGSVPGTSFMRTWAGDGTWTNGPYGTYGTRLAADVIAHAPDVVLVQGSSNDVGSGYTVDQVVNAAAAVFTALRAELPAAQLIVTFPLFWQRTAGGMGKAPALYDPYRAGMKAAAVGAGATWIDPITDKWITGTGCAAATAGDGNGDVYLVNDGAHPNTAGHAYLGTRLAFAIRPPNTGLVG